MSDFDNLLLDGADKDLEEFLTIEKTKQEVNRRIHVLNEMCWDKCMGKPVSKLDSSTETCLSNCVNRFIDTSLLITQRYAQLLQE